MSFVIEKHEPVPLSLGSDGVIRIAGTRVSLDAIAEAFRDGATAEEIVQQYPTLSLADVYSVCGYLLRHPTEIADYLKSRTKQREDMRLENERRFAPEGVRARLLARRG
jgi:uncharacterized protein (DUF433 family)